jgi:hypothetical protein
MNPVSFYLIIAYHIEPTTLDDGDYELVLGQDQGFSVTVHVFVN